MGRGYLILTFLFLVSATAQEPSTPAATPQKETAPGRKESSTKGSVEIPRWMQERINKLSEQDRRTFLENLSKWAELKDTEKRAYREKFRGVRKMMREDAEKALKQTGLPLDADRREVFHLRYVQERRRIEKELREETDKRRRQLLDELTVKLKEEFEPYSKASEATASQETPAPEGG